MPSIEIGRRYGLWTRVVAVCAVLGAVAFALLAAEALFFGVVSYVAIVAVDGAIRTVSPDPALAPVGALLATLLSFALLGATYRAAKRSGRGLEFAPRLLAYAYVALIAASLAVTYWVLRWLGFPGWVFGVLVITIVALAYPMAGYKLARDRSAEDGGEEGTSWSVGVDGAGAAGESDAPDGDESSAPDDVPSDTGSSRTESAVVEDGSPRGRLGAARARIRENRARFLSRWRASLADRLSTARAVWAELRRPVAVLAERYGRPGVATAGLFAVGVFLGVYVLADIRPPSTLRLPLAAGVALVVTAGHIGSEVRSELAETVVLRELDDAFDGPTADGTDARLRRRMTRLAAIAEVPPPDVRVLRSRTPHAAAVGYRPSSSTLVVSTGLLETLEPAELDAVLAHELAHVANRDAAVLTALSFPQIAGRRAFERYGLNPVMAVFAGVVAATGRLCTAVVARAREYSADDGAVAITGDPAALASALETLDSAVARRPDEDLRAATAFSVVPPAWEEHRFFDRTRRLVARGLLGTHPPTDARIERLRERVGERET